MSKQSSREYVVVSYMSSTEAEDALSVAKEKFHKKLTPAEDLSYCKGNTVFLQRCPLDPSYVFMKYFLLKLNGAQPDGCHCQA